MIARKFSVLVVSLALVVLLSACDSGGDAVFEGKIGMVCTIQLRRDALGGAANLPVPPLTGEINGAQVSLTGKLERVTDRWIVLSVSGKSTAVSREAILLVQLRS